MTVRRRLDVELVRRGLAPSRAVAHAAIAQHRVTVGGALAAKPSRLVAPSDPVELLGPPARFVGRGGEKLDAALSHFAIDVAGHRMTDALLAAMLHQAFLLGAIYELDRYGQITRRLFEHLNTRFYQSSGMSKFVSLIYGEISDDAKFRFLSAGQPYPSVFSRHHDRFMEVSPHLCLSFPPLGMLPSFNVIDRNTTPSLLGFKERYEMNEWTLMGRGDILLMHTDGLTEHEGPNGRYFPGPLEQKLREVKHLTARQIYDAINADLIAFAEPIDDASVVVIKVK